jgi:translocation and assembly module TamB
MVRLTRPIARGVRTLLAAAWWLAFFVASLLAAVWLHLDLPLSRRVVATQANALMADLFEGRLVLGRLDRLTSDELQLADIVVRAPGDAEVLRVDRLVVRGSWLEALARVATGDRELRLDFVRLEHADVALHRHDSGRLALAAAFTPRKPRDPKPKPPSEPAARPFVVVLPAIELGRVRVFGEPQPGIPLDAEVRRLRAALRVDDGVVMLDVERSGVAEKRLLGAAAIGTVSYQLRSQPLRMAANFSGSVGKLQIQADGSLTGRDVDVSVDLPRVGADELEPWLPTRPLQAPLVAHLGIRGRMPNLALEGVVQLPAMGNPEAGVLRLAGAVAVDEPALVDATIALRGLNTRLFRPAGPSSNLSGVAHLRGVVDGRDSQLAVALQTAASRYGDYPLPSMSGRAELAVDGARGYLRLDDGGARGRASVALRQGKLDFAGAVALPDLGGPESVPRVLAGIVGLARARGRGQLHAEGWVDAEELDMAVDVDASGVSMAGTQVGAGGVRGRLYGSRANPQVRAHARASAVASGGQRIDSAELTANGPLMRPTLRARLRDPKGRTIEASGELDPAQRALRGVGVQVEAGGSKVTGRVGRVAATPRGLAVDGLSLEGLGETISGGLRVEGGELLGTLRGEGVDLRALSRLVGLATRLDGRASVDIDLERAAGGRRGHVRLRLDDASAPLVSGLNGKAELQFDGDKVSSRLKLALAGDAPAGERCGGTIATVGLEGEDGRLKGPLLNARTWRRAAGSLRVDAKKVDLGCLVESLSFAAKLLPLSKVAGVLDATATLRRAANDPLPSVDDFRLRTTGLVLVPRVAEDAKEPAWSSDTSDVELRALFDAANSRAALNVALVDARLPPPPDGLAALRRPRRQQPLVELDTSVAGDFEGLVAGGKRQLEALGGAQIKAELTVPRRALRELGALPHPVRGALAGTGGEAAAKLYFDGTLAEPTAAIRLQTWGLRSPGLQAVDMPLDIDVLGNYQAGHASVDATVASGGRRLATFDARAEGTLQLGPVHDATVIDDWRGSMRGRLLRFPLASVPALAHRGVRGRVSGRLEIDGMGEHPELSLHLRSRRLKVGRRTELRRVRLSLEPAADGNPRTVVAKGELLSKDGGRLHITGYTGLSWQKLAVPTPDPNAPAAVLVVAERFPLRTIETFVAPTITRVDGRLDGALHLSYKETPERPVGVDVDMRVADGVVHIPRFGQELRGVRASLRSDGDLLHVKDFTAEAGDGRATGWVKARLDGLDVADLTASFDVKEGEDMPLSVDGVPLGAASGTLILSASRRKKELDLAMSAANVHIQLPSTSGRDVQPLQPHGDVTLSHPLEPPKDDERRIGDTRVNLTLAIGEAVLEGPSLRLALATNPELPVKTVGDAGLSGELVLDGGEFNLLGKVFQIDRGIVRLDTEEAGNPYVNVTAHWTAPDGSIIYCDYVGLLNPISDDKIRFRSSPPRSEQAIVSMLILGDAAAEGSPLELGANGGQRANSLGRGIAAAQINAVLGGVAPGFSTAVGTTQEGNLSTSLIYQVSDRVTAQATFEAVDDQGPAQQDATTTETGGGGQRTSVSVDWRFHPSWLLRGTVGLGNRASSGLELLFQHRYE